MSLNELNLDKFKISYAHSTYVLTIESM